jgi:cytidylate kinase
VAFDVVCISAEDGAGGLAAASLVARELSFRLIDEDIVTRAAVEAGVDREVVADVEKRKGMLSRLLDGISAAGFATGTMMATPPADLEYGGPASDELRGLIRSVIEETASTGSTVIVSHAASLALADREGVLRVLVIASAPIRQERLESSLGLDAKEAERTLKRSDAGRADYIRRFYGVGEELPSHYDLVLNTDRLTPEDAARLIVQAARDGS